MSAKEQLTSTPLLTLDEASTLLRRSHWTLRGDIKSGRLKCIRIGRRILIERAEIEVLIDKARQRPIQTSPEYCRPGSDSGRNNEA